MNYSNQESLYKELMSVFEAKQRLLKNDNIKISNATIWKYLAKNKWAKTEDLSLYEIVDDIMNFDINEMGGMQE